jgi:hypothetical protein
MAITTARIHQAVISSAAAQVITIAPNLVLWMPRSCTILAKTGSGDTQRTPINKLNDGI